MKNSEAMIKMVRRSKLNGLISRQENRERQRSRLYRIRQDLAQNYKDRDSDIDVK